jgi:RNA polymerase sigma-70 factor, ECF subfamily
VDPHVRFEQLYRAHADRVHAFALRRTTASAADDVVAEVFLIAWRRLHQVPDRPFPWLLGVARRVLANRRRGEGRASALQVRLAQARRFDDASMHVDAVDQGVLSALAALGERDRELLMLIAWEGLDQAEVAHVLGLRRGTVAVRLHRARQRFAAALAAQETDLLPDVEVTR